MSTVRPLKRVSSVGARYLPWWPAADASSLKTPRTLRDIANASNIKKKDVARCYRLLIRELDLKMPVVDPVKCVARIASKAGLSEKTKRKALEILKKAEEGKISAGKDPMGLVERSALCCLRNEWRKQDPKRRGRSGWRHRSDDQEPLQRTQNTSQALRESTSLFLSSTSSSILSIKSDIFTEFNSDSIIPRQTTMSASIVSSPSSSFALTMPFGVSTLVYFLSLPEKFLIEGPLDCYLI